jgi:DNA/RNA-binding domain of Phe-tRNA-synthetase-like protein
MSVNIREAVTASFEQKIRAGEQLAAAIDTLALAEQAAKDAAQEVAKMRREALVSGWDERELKRLGLAANPRAKTAKRAPKDSSSSPVEPEEVPPTSI